jgi:hypothetical protein
MAAQLLGVASHQALRDSWRCQLPGGSGGARPGHGREKGNAQYLATPNGWEHHNMRFPKRQGAVGPNIDFAPWNPNNVFQNHSHERRLEQLLWTRIPLQKNIMRGARMLKNY